jgi:hypothetical protein
LTGTTFAQDDVRAAVTAASLGIENACGRRFTEGTADVVRYYSPQSDTLCLIDDATAVTKVETGDGDGDFDTELTVHTGYELYPLNAAADDEPYTRLQTVGSAFFWQAVRTVKVTGTWGWPSVPPAVVEATTIMASKLLRRAREAPFGIISVGIDVGATTRIAMSDPDVRWLLAPYVREKL